jgi:hypothetical protein
MKLYEIEFEFRKLVKELTEDEFTPELGEALAINQSQLFQKSEGYCFAVKELIAEYDIIKSEIERLNGLLEKRKKAIDYLKKTVLDAMNLYGLEKIETPILKINIRNSKSIEIISDEQISDEYKKIVTTISISKTDIKKAIESGINVAGAIIRNNKSLQIK